MGTNLHMYWFIFSNTEFVGFNSGQCAAIGVTSITGKCVVGCGGYTYKFNGKSTQLCICVCYHNMCSDFYATTINLSVLYMSSYFNHIYC